MDAYITHVVADPGRHVEVNLACVIGWMVDTARGVWHLHHSGVTATLHRDLKPPNFLAVRRGEGSGAGSGASGGASAYAQRVVTVKLGDFGVAHVGMHGLASSVAGNLYTQAPEVNMHGASPAADVFAWAVSMCWVSVQVRVCA